MSVCRKVLLVEDAPITQKFLTEIVLATPHLRLTCLVETSADALVAFECDRPDLVILDLVLRAGSGLDVLREFKRRAPACIVVVFTSHAGSQYRQRCLADGADRFFSKGLQNRELLQFLRTLGDETPAATPTKSPLP